MHSQSATARKAQINARSSARPNVFKDLVVTTRRALVPIATSSGFAAARVGHGKAVIFRHAGGHDGGVADDGGADWAGCYAWSAGREPRPLLLAACPELGRPLPARLPQGSSKSDRCLRLAGGCPEPGNRTPDVWE
jgi:hypothetical protein